MLTDLQHKSQSGRRVKPALASSCDPLVQGQIRDVKLRKVFLLIENPTAFPGHPGARLERVMQGPDPAHAVLGLGVYFLPHHHFENSRSSKDSGHASIVEELGCALRDTGEEFVLCFAGPFLRPAHKGFQGCVPADADDGDHGREDAQWRDREDEAVQDADRLGERAMQI
ncbi:hypothetical protein BO86DRAFT_377651 [Aspergillus japonicus CBS 114.51]|uniref:Uncharacterized protein n=2 Tax=Aspergillus TaxID=5052 RepID=A0A2V5GZ31_ASPV1|nr:hypothetical protein BO86DRAFT_377651 [Aspergillus japonicus CBS 114.51]PYI13613.1 hypothetical protein BO99DRAFT_417493 [Aspergillus violaceofuscus CBS 115571]RAH83782.1 hypothetical protein BO86DRAFT_377651 [Aspergillus japonicus CBS 114.51]